MGRRAGKKAGKVEQTGEVIEVKKGMLTIRFDRPEACQHCNACKGEKHQALIEIPGQAEVGDRVTVSMPEGQVAKASLMAYAIPLAGLVLGLMLGWGLGGEVPAIIGAALGLAGSIVVLRINESRLRRDSRWTPQLMSVEKPER